MPGTTPVYGFPYPEPTDLVADYPALGQQLAEDIEGVLPGIGGLTVIAPTSIANSGGSATSTGGVVTFTGVSSISLNGVFSATYRRYMLVWSGGGSTSPGTACNMRLRASGTDASGANYFMQRSQFYASTAAAVRSTSQTSVLCGFFDSIGTTLASYLVSNPFLAASTLWLGTSGSNADTSNNAQLDGTYASHSLTTSYDGFTLFPSAGTATGIIRVYGIKD
jgi:hypothetical protein